jgi:hypothetical protein
MAKSVAHGALLNASHTCGHRNHDFGTKQVEAPGDEADEVPQHRFGGQVIRDYAVSHRPDHADGARCAALHGACLGADRDDGVVPVMSCHNRGLVDDDAVAFDIDQGVGGAEIDPGTFRGQEFHRH